jgi:DNA helicase-2/ATP-dependent DNA helicase PcrA
VRSENELFNRAEIRDVIAYLRLAYSPADSPALARVINTPPRRLRHVEQALRRLPVPVAELPGWAHKRGGPPARRRVEELLALVNRLHAEAEGCTPSQVLGQVLDRTGYDVWVAGSLHADRRLASLQEFGRVLEGSAALDLGTWLADLHLGELDSTAADQAGAVALSTVHGAKGQEWPVVFLLGVEDGLLPMVARFAADQSLDDEERRLVYVAVSRPQVLLYLTYCLSRRPVVDGETGLPERRRLSRYLYTLPANVVERVA